MAFSQITYSESLRDIEACLSAQSDKLYHMGLRGPIRRSTLADANETRDWRIYAEFAQRLIAQARRLYAGDDLDVELPSTVYALDSTTIDLCLSVFPWAHFRSTKAAVKMHTLLVPSFIPLVSGQLPHSFNWLAFTSVIGAKVWATPHFFLASIRRGRLFASCAAAIQPFRPEPCRA